MQNNEIYVRLRRAHNISNFVNFLDERIDTNVTARATFIFGNHKADYSHPYYKSLYRHIKASNLPIDKEKLLYFSELIKRRGN